MPNDFCVRCGSRRHGDGRFCRTCGASLDTSPDTSLSLDTPPHAAPPPATPAATPAPSPRGLAVVAGVAALAVCVGVAATVGWVLLRSDGPPSAGTGEYDGARIPVAAAGEASATTAGVDLLAEPTTEWTFDPAAVRPGARLGPMRAFEGDPGYAEQIGVGDVLVLSVVGPDTGQGTLVGLESGTGQVRWQLDGTGGTPGCQLLDDAGPLLCELPATDDPDDVATLLTLVDPATGERTARSSVPVDYPLSVASDDLVVSLEGGSGPTKRVVAVDPTTLEERWTTSLDTSDRPTSTDPGRVWFADDRVVVGLDDRRWVLDAGSGEQAPDASIEGVPDGDYRIEVIDPFTDDARTTVRDLGGFTLLSAPGDPWGDLDSPGYITDGRIGVGDTLYDLATGDAVWASGAPYAGHTIVADQSLVLVEDDPPSSRLLDHRSGDEVWSAPGSLLTDGADVTPEAVLDLAEGVVEVSPTGGRSGGWSRDLGDLLTSDDSLYPIGTIGHTNTSVVVTGSDGTRGFSGFPELAAGAAGALGEGSSDAGAGTSYVTDCGSEPEVTPVEATAADGGVSMRYVVTATCPDGQWWASSGQRVVLTVDGTTYLSGVFDFADEPRWIPADGTEMDLVYPPGSALATPEEVNDAVEEDLAADGSVGEQVVVECERDAGGVLGAVPADPSDADPGTDPVVSDGPPADGSVDGETALETLRRIAAADAPVLDADVAGSWVPQLSSKRDGLLADGLTWDHEAILAEHLRLRLRYPGVRLAFSTDWGAFENDGYWVTLVAGEPTAGPEPALGFCRSSYFDADHCYAKQLVRGGSSEGRTRLLPD